MEWNLYGNKLGSTFKSRISMNISNTDFEKVKALMTARRILIEMRKIFDKCFILSVVLYGNESWKQGRYLENVEMLF